MGCVSMSVARGAATGSVAVPWRCWAARRPVVAVVVFIRGGGGRGNARLCAKAEAEAESEAVVVEDVLDSRPEAIAVAMGGRSLARPGQGDVAPVRRQAGMAGGPTSTQKVVSSSPLLAAASRMPVNQDKMTLNGSRLQLLGADYLHWVLACALHCACAKMRRTCTSTAARLMIGSAQEMHGQSCPLPSECAPGFRGGKDDNVAQG